MLHFLLIIIEQSLLYLPLLLGAYISFSLMKTPDLSIESAYLFGGLAAYFAIQHLDGYPLPLVLCAALIASIIGGSLVGLTSSCLSHFGKIPHLLSSIITFGLCHGLFQLLSTPYVSLATFGNPLMLLPYVDKHPEFCTVALVCALLLIAGYVMLSTQLSYSLAIFGQNPLFFKHFRISTAYVFITGIFIANGLAGLSGYLFAQTNNLVEMNMGIGKVLFCITALILGKTCALSTPRTISLLAPVRGAILYFALQQMLLQGGFNLKYFTAVQAVVVLVILLTIYKKSSSPADQLGV